MKEKLQEYALIAEIAGGIAIVASLIFVGLQINQNHEMMRAQIRSELATSISERLWNMSQSEYQNIYDMSVNSDSLAPEDQQRLSMFLGAMFRLYENFYYQYEMGLFDESEFSVEATGWQGLVNSPAGKQYFCRSAQSFSEGFRNFLLGSMRSPCP